MGQHGHRNMFYATGLPGWMRFGYSPGWGGIPPGAQYLQQTGQLPQAMDWFSQQYSARPAQPQPSTLQTDYSPTPQLQMPAQTSKEQEIRMLEDQIGSLENQVEQIKNRIKQLRSQSK